MKEMMPLVQDVADCVTTNTVESLFCPQFINTLYWVFSQSSWPVVGTNSILFPAQMDSWPVVRTISIPSTEGKTSIVMGLLDITSHLHYLGGGEVERIDAMYISTAGFLKFNSPKADSD